VDLEIDMGPQEAAIVEYINTLSLMDRMNLDVIAGFSLDRIADLAREAGMTGSEIEPTYWEAAAYLHGKNKGRSDHGMNQG